MDVGGDGFQGDFFRIMAVQIKKDFLQTLIFRGADSGSASADDVQNAWPGGKQRALDEQLPPRNLRLFRKLQNPGERLRKTETVRRASVEKKDRGCG